MHVIITVQNLRKMKSNRKLGDKINRGFVLIVLILGSIMIIRFAVAVVKHDTEYIEYRESDFENDEKDQ